MNGAASSNSNPSDVQGVCPVGWHLPGDDEWKQLEVQLGMNPSVADLSDWRGTDEGGKLKEAGTITWNTPNTGAINKSGFNVLPAGCRVGIPDFNYINYYADFWSSTENHSSTSIYRSLHYDHTDTYRSNNNKSYGFSVRCIKD